MKTVAFKERFLLASAAGAVLLTVLAGSRAWASDPTQATYSWDDSKIFWIMHISDSHLGATYDTYDDEASLRWGLGEAIDVVDPVVVWHTGDIVDGSPNGIVTSGQEDEEWILYRSIVDDSNLTADFYVDLPGNHDAYGDEGLTHYLQYSLNGSTYGKLTRSMELSFPWGNYFLYGMATVDETGSRFLEHPEVTQAELDELDAELTAHDSDRLTFVLGHHTLEDPDRMDEAVAMMQAHNTFYFHGHVHAYGSYMDHGLVVSQVNSLGKADEDNLAVIAVDNDAVSYAATSSSDPWPFVVVTAPVSSRLDSGEANPYAYTVCNRVEAVPVRVLVFDLNQVSAVTVTAGASQDVPLTRSASMPQLWTGTFDPSNLPEGEAVLTVNAYGSHPRSREIHFLVGDVTCPGGADQDAGPADDAGLEDAGLADSSQARDGAQEADAQGGQDGEMNADASQHGQDAEIVGAGSSSPSGCSCRAPGSGSGPAGFVFLLLGIAFLARRRFRFFR